MQLLGVSGVGKVEHVDDLRAHTESETEPKKKETGSMRATAICGNDITSSCLYVTAWS